MEDSCWVIDVWREGLLVAGYWLRVAGRYFFISYPLLFNISHFPALISHLYDLRTSHFVLLTSYFKNLSPQECGDLKAVSDRYNYEQKRKPATAGDSRFCMLIRFFTIQERIDRADLCLVVFIGLYLVIAVKFLYRCKRGVVYR